MARSIMISISTDIRTRGLSLNVIVSTRTSSNTFLCDLASVWQPGREVAHLYRRNERLLVMDEAVDRHMLVDRFPLLADYPPDLVESITYLINVRTPKLKRKISRALTAARNAYGQPEEKAAT